MPNTQEIYKCSRIWYSFYLKTNEKGEKISVESVYIDISPRCSWIYRISENGERNKLRVKRRDKNFNLRYKIIIKLIENYYINRDPSSFITIIPRSIFQKYLYLSLGNNYFSINSFPNWIKLVENIYNSVNYQYFTIISSTNLWEEVNVRLLDYLEWIRNNINLLGK